MIQSNMRKVFSYVRSPLGIFFVLLISQLVLYVITTYRPFIIAPPGYSYTAMGNFYSYPNFILQAKDGSWDTFDLGTTRPTTHVRAQLFFVMLGKIAALFNIHQIAMYRIAQMTGGIAVFIVSYWLIRKLLPKYMHASAIFFVLGLEIGPLLNAIAGQKLINWPASFISQVSFQRHFGLPHHNWAEAFGLMLFGALYYAISQPTILRLLILALIAFTATITLPSYVITMMLALGPIFLLWGFIKNNFRKTILPLFIASIVIVLTGLFVRAEFARGLPWSTFSMTEKTWWKNNDQIVYYLSSFTLYYPFFLLAIAGAISSWRTWHSSIRFAFLFSLTWILVPLVCIPVSTASWFPIANFRLTDGYQYFPAGILAVIGFYQIQKKIRVFLIVPIVAASISLTYVFTANIWSSQTALWSNIYPATSTMDAIEHVSTLPKYSGILVREYAGNIMAAYADVRIFLGAYHFPDFWERSAIAQTFFSGTLSDEAARATLHDNDISYVFYGPDERSWNTTGTLYPNVLKPIYTTATVTIFARKK
jgi:hypothetical protein